jgi:hypothetical protein
LLLQQLEVHEITWELLPPYSPDLNTIEHLWFRLEEETHRLHPALLTMGGSIDTKNKALKQAMLEGWEVVRADRELIQTLAESRRRRLDAVRVYIEIILKLGVYSPLMSKGVIHWSKIIPGLKTYGPEVLQ